MIRSGGGLLSEPRFCYRDSGAWFRTKALTPVVSNRRLRYGSVLLLIQWNLINAT